MVPLALLCWVVRRGLSAPGMVILGISVFAVPLAVGLHPGGSSGRALEALRGWAIPLCWAGATHVVLTWTEGAEFLRMVPSRARLVGALIALLSCQVLLLVPPVAGAALLGVAPWSQLPGILWGLLWTSLVAALCLALPAVNGIRLGFFFLLVWLLPSLFPGAWIAHLGEAPAHAIGGHVLMTGPFPAGWSLIALGALLAAVFALHHPPRPHAS